MGGPPSKAEGRIVGGHEAQENQWPWQVALFIDDAWFCGGALISENYVLTAAHCADGASYFDIMAGAHNVRQASEPHRVEITSYNGWTHPGWNTQDLSNDIALIELPSPIDFNDYIKPSCMLLMETLLMLVSSSLVLDGVSPLTALEASPPSSGWLKIFLLSPMLNATVSMESLV